MDTRDMTREQKEDMQLGPPRYKVRIRGDGGKMKTLLVDGLPKWKQGLVSCWIFSQTTHKEEVEDGKEILVKTINVHLAAEDELVSVWEEHQNYYEEWKKTRTIKPEELKGA